jgi:branched-chain amino acid aminotransferase
MIPILTKEQCQERWEKFQHPSQKTYYAFYSSVLGGITTDPAFMTVPLDDHLVHRGDGVFEALKCKSGGVFLWGPHKERMMKSAMGLGLKVPENLEEAVSSAVKASGQKDCIIRIFLSRGPGYFSTNPYDSIGEQLYVVITKWIQMADKYYLEGASIGRSLVPPKESWLAQIKTCNYLPNVMMKKEAVERKLDFTIGFDANGNITESGTENIVILTEKNILARPKYKQILKGTTMTRTLELAQALKADGAIKDVTEMDLKEEDLLAAKEVMMIGTTLDVLPVTRYEGNKIANGQVGPVAKALLKMLHEDQVSGPLIWKW